MEKLIETILFHYSYLQLFGLTVAYFTILYFGLGALFLATCKLLARYKILHKITDRKVSAEQVMFEIKHSIQSIVLFGLSAIPIIYLVRIDLIKLLPDTATNILLGLMVLTLWNEIHFYFIHRLLHQKFLMNKVHYIHHKSTIPTTYSVYSFHWLEAILLSTVPITIVPFIPFSVVAVLIYPTVSILINFAGHCNYRFGSGTGDRWWLLGTYHHEHHSKGRKNFGFALNFLDKMFSKQK